MSPLDLADGKIEAEGELYLYDSFWNRLNELISESPLFDELIDTLQKPEPLDWYDIREYDLSTERVGERIDNFPSDGDIVLVLSYTGKAEIRFDSSTSDSFDLETLKKVKHTYSVLYLSNEAQSGDSIKILFGRGNWNITETRPEIDLQGTIRNDYLDQITDPSKIGQIISDSHVIPHANILAEKILISATTRLDQWRSSEDYTYMDPGRILLHSTTTLADWRHPSDLTLIAGGQIFTHSIEADKLNILTHILSGATWADNDPAAGSVSWAGAEVTYNGSTYSITDGNTNLAYIWWDYSLSTTTFQTSNVKPTLTDDDFIVVYNDSGTHELIWNATLIDGRTIRTGSLTAAELTITDLVDIANLLTVAAGRIVIGADVLGAGLDGILINDGTYDRVEMGEISAGNYGITIRDASGNAIITLGDYEDGSIIADKLSITDLVDITNLLTVAAGRIVIGADVLGAGLDGLLITDAGAVRRVELGEVSAGIFALNVRDSGGVLITDEGQVTQRWQKIREVDIIVNTQFYDFSALNGNIDKEYYIKAKFVSAAGAVAMNYGVRPNADGGANYSFQTIWGIAGTPGASQNNAFDSMWLGRADNTGELSQGWSYLFAETGHPRMALTIFSAMVTAGGNFGRGYVAFTTWHNTGTNITSLRIWAEQANGIGIGSHIELWRRVG